MSQVPAEFAVSYDQTTKIVTGVAGAVLFGGSLFIQQPFVIGIAFLIVVLAYAFSPRGYVVADRSLVVRRLIGDAHLRLESVREVRRAAAEDFRGCIRLFGSGGMFGYYGIFRTSKLGVSTWYVTNRRNAIVIVTDSGTRVYSPDDTDAFLAAIQANGAPSAQPPSAAPAANSFRAWTSVAIWGGIAIGAVSIGLVVMAVTYAPGPPAYTVTANSLTIHDRFYPVTIQASEVAVPEIRSINIANDPAWRPTMRTNGFANSHYRSGWFRAANGKKIRLYRADATQLVLLPPKGDGTPVVMEVNEPARFVADLQREWGSRP